MPRDKFLVKFNDKIQTVSSRLTRDQCYQNDLYGAKYPEVFGFRLEDPDGPAHLRAVDRVIEYFHRLNDSRESHMNDDMWGQKMREHQGDQYLNFEQALLQRDHAGVSAVLRNICKTRLVTGFYSSDISEADSVKEDFLHICACHLFDTLVSMASAFGYPLDNPEQGFRNLAEIDFEQLVDFVLQNVPALRYPPRAGGGMFGLNTNNGVIAWRDLTSAFNATRVVATLGDLPPKVCEIGGGIGSMAYFLAQMGVSSSIFDLPVVSLLQAYFLITCLGGDQVWICGEEANPSAKVRILPWWEFARTDDDEFPVIVNVDSLPEIEYRVALNYIDAIHSKGQRWFLSINQESAAMNTDTTSQNIVGDLVAIRGGFKRCYRFPYWLRPGYVEELYQILK